MSGQATHLLVSLKYILSQAYDSCGSQNGHFCNRAGLHSGTDYWPQVIEQLRTFMMVYNTFAMARDFSIGR